MQREKVLAILSRLFQWRTLPGWAIVSWKGMSALSTIAWISGGIRFLRPALNWMSQPEGNLTLIVVGVVWVAFFTALPIWKHGDGAIRQEFDRGIVLGASSDVDNHLYISFTNLWRTDTFSVQIVGLSGVHPSPATLPWDVRWDGSAEETVQVLKEQTKVLRLCIADLMGVIHDPKTGHWKPGKFTFFAPTAERVAFLQTPPGTTSETLPKLRLGMTIKIFALSMNLVTVRQLTIGFDEALRPELVGLQTL